MSDTAELPSFDDADLAAKVERLSARQVDALPFGVIRLDASGIVTVYNETERRLSGSGDLQRHHLDFFTQVAPCLDTAAFRGRIERARMSGKLKIEFSHVGDFDDADREFVVKVQSAPGGECWIFIDRRS